MAPRAPGDSVRPRRASDVVVRPLNFTVRAHVNAAAFSNLIRVLFVIAFVVMVGTRQYYTRHMPSTPQPLEQRLVPVSVNYGKTVYVTGRERNYLYASYAWCALMLGATLVLYAADRRQKAR